jgi:uncharacterized membrane protein
MSVRSTQPIGSRYVDLLLILFGGIVLGLFIVLGEFYPEWTGGSFGWVIRLLRLILGLIYVLYVPGYLLQASFFPRLDDLDRIERTGLSLGLSVAQIVLLALLLDRLPWGIFPTPILLGQAVMILVLIAVLAIARVLQSPGQLYHPQVFPRLDRVWVEMGRGERGLLLGLSMGLPLAALVTAWIFLVPSPGEFMTEFYILGKDGLAEDYPGQVDVIEPLQVAIGITNRERTPLTYRLEVWVQDSWINSRRQQVGELGPFGLDPGQSFEQPVTWVMPWLGEDQQVLFLLFTDNQPDPYRRLVLWLDVTN